MISGVRLDKRQLTGWSRTAPTTSYVLTTADIEVVAKAVSDVATVNEDKPSHLRRGIIARGLGRSYNESAQNSGGVVVDMTLFNRIHSISVDTGIADVEAGVSLESLMKAALPFGLWVPVLPGTRQVTIGGAIAHDIHGKSHHTTGSFGNHVLEMTLLGASGDILVLTPDGSRHDPDGSIFWATIGGIGLTGIVLRAKILMERTETAYFLADGARTRSLDETIELHQNGWENGHEFAAGWFDTISKPPKLGRGSFSRGRLAKVDELPAKLARNPLKFDAPTLLNLPDVFPNGLANKYTLWLVGEVYYRMGGDYTGQIKNLTGFYHLLDLFGDWNRAYGSHGFVQYQFTVPMTSVEEFKQVIRDIQASGHYSGLNVFKLFGKGNKAPLSFPTAGWNITVDFPVKAGLKEFLTALDQRVLEMGGRLYTGKDSRTTADVFHSMYPRIDAWIATRRRVDPTGVFLSDMARRLDLG
ncbi:FAD-binding protein [Actinokineospora sp.]|uniref:FAD-binding protein n=1 Tax=Actinokineospora sp. TaxID=1872133 RepID=UPI004037EA28